MPSGKWLVLDDVVYTPSSGINGSVYLDLNQNCLKETNETGISGRSLLIQPGNIVVQTNSAGDWHLDSLPIGTYSISVDTSGSWISTCPTIQYFTYNGGSVFYAPDFGFVSTTPCATANVSIHMPFIRRGFSNQRVYVQACNEQISTRILNSAYTVVELDQHLTVQAASNTYTSLGNNRFQVNLGNLAPGQCSNIWFDCQVSMNTVLGQTLCMNAVMYPIDSCSLNQTPEPFTPGTVSPCNTPWDRSSLRVEGECVNDSIRFVIYNTGSSSNGNMTCFAPVRLYIDGQYVMLDSIQLAGGDSAVFMFSGDGRTWRLEADQHPLHPGFSHPNASVELCGNAANWIPNLINNMPQDDIDPAIDIYCGITTGSYDPNDKTGFPLGLGTTHDILPNQDIEYLIRFQNTGTDTAFTIVIRDTLQNDFDLFSVRSGVSSNNYEFRMYGPRVLEWTFNNIMLPDSNVNEPASHGFVKFTVKQNRDLPIGTLLENSAAIYFDFNPPIITNTYFHTIDTPRPAAQIVRQTISTAACNSYNFHGYNFAAPGNYFVPVSNNGIDSLYILQLTDLATNNTINTVVCGSYTLNGQNYTSSGTYTQSFTNAAGCDSTITLNLTILNNNALILNETACDSYMLNGQNYTASGTYSITIPNSVGCDSVITLNLNINNSSNHVIDESSCGFYSLNGMIYTSSGTYTQILTNAAGCDSIITLKVAIFNNSNTVLTESACTEYTLNGQTYTRSGTYNQMFTNASGCDSLVTLNLTLVDTSISINNNILTANTANATYQWLDCDNGFAPISGATGQTFEPTANGSYAVQIINGGCTVQSGCFNYVNTAITAHELSGINVYPNPTTGKLNLDFGNLQQVSTQLIDLNGRLLMQLFFENQNGQIDMTELPAGMFFLRISSNGKTETIRVVKH